MALALALPLVAPPGAEARGKPPKRRLCADHVTVRDAPYGHATGHLYRPQKLRVYGRPVDRWVLIRAHDGLMGWIPKKALCAARKR